MKYEDINGSSTIRELLFGGVKAVLFVFMACIVLGLLIAGCCGHPIAWLPMFLIMFIMTHFMWLGKK